MAATYRLTFDASGEPTRIKDDFAASAAPDANDDFSTGGWKVGSLWYVPTTDTLYICEDQTTAAAVWTVVGSASTSDADSLVQNLSVSGAHTADRATAATHDLTMTGDTTLTPDHSSPPTGKRIDLGTFVRQDGTGGHVLTIAGTVTWSTSDGNPPDMPTAANAMLALGFVSLDDAVTWIGFAGVGGTTVDPATTVESETTFGISAAVGTDTEYARQDHTHGTPADPVTAAAIAAVGYWAPLVDSGTGDLIRDSGTNEVIMAFVPTP